MMSWHENVFRIPVPLRRDSPHKEPELLSRNVSLFYAVEKSVEVPGDSKHHDTQMIFDGSLYKTLIVGLLSTMFSKSELLKYIS